MKWLHALQACVRGWYPKGKPENEVLDAGGELLLVPGWVPVKFHDCVDVDGVTYKCPREDKYPHFRFNDAPSKPFPFIYPIQRYDVILVDYGPRKLWVLKHIRESLGWSIQDLRRSVPLTLVSGVSDTRSLEVMLEFEALRASIRIDALSFQESLRVVFTKEDHWDHHYFNVDVVYDLNDPNTTASA